LILIELRTALAAIAQEKGSFQRGEAEMLEFREVKSEARVFALTGKLNDFDLFSLILA
jgi:hypothetical protein